jgi:putative acyl-CoA dehydrogenase
MDTNDAVGTSYHPTHEVLNQSPPLEDVDLFSTDKALVEALEREGAGWAAGMATEFGKLMGSREVVQWGFDANRNPPVLRTHDRNGRRVDEVDFHPAWHELLRLSMGHRLHCLPWSDPRPGAHVARAALMFIAAQVEAGHGCPISMTYASVPALRKQPEIWAEWKPRICTATYDRRFIPARDKTGVLLGMAMTEKQGGSDVRAITTRAVPVGGGDFVIEGHKWFCSAPMCDAFLVLAKASGGISCFLVPRWKPDGTRNNFFIQRLKDKLGNRSNASSEVEFAGTHGRLVGEEGRGVPTIIEVANHTRLDCALSSAGLMRQAVARATHHARYRSVFGRKLADQPLMQNVLADLCVESEAATALAMRLARAYDRADDAEFEGPLRRLLTPVAKYWLCKRTPAHVVEALECLGGNGYVEDFILARLYREAPLNSVWEGSGNVICLDVLRAMNKEPHGVEAFLHEIEMGSGGDKRLDAYLTSLKSDFRKTEDFESRARRLVERMALALQASLLVQHAPPVVADAFCASRLSGDWGHTFGTLPAGVDVAAIVARATP